MTETRRLAAGFFACCLALGGVLAGEPDEPGTGDPMAQAPSLGLEEPEAAGAAVVVGEDGPEGEEDLSAIERFLRSRDAQAREEALPDPEAEYTLNPPVAERFLFQGLLDQLTAPLLAIFEAEEVGEASPLFDAVGAEAKSRFVRGAYLGHTGFGARSAEYFFEAVREDPENLFLKFRAAEALLAQNDLPRAERLLDEILEADPGDARALLLRARIAEFRNRRAEAIEWYERVLEAAPRNLQALSSMARIAYYESQDLEETKRLCELILTTARRSQPEYLNALLWNAEAHALTGDVQNATELYAQLIRYRPSLVTRLSDMGIRLVRMGRRDDALGLFRAGVVMAPAADSVRMQWESLLRESGGSEAVMGGYRGLADEFPLDLRIQELLAEHLARVDDRAGLRAQRFAMLEVEPRHIPSLLSLARLSWSEGDMDEARYYFERAIAAGPDSASVYRDVAMAYMGEGELERAEQLLTEAFAMDPKDADTLLALAALAERMENPANTERFLRSALDASPANARILRLFGDFMRREGRPQRAAELYEQVLAVDPRDLGVLVDLATLYHELGNHDALDRMQDQSSRNIEEPLAFYINYGVLAMDYAAWDRARWAFERALRSAPQDLATRSTLADAYLLMGDGESAERVLLSGRQHLPEGAEAAFEMRLHRLYRDMRRDQDAMATAERLVEIDDSVLMHHQILILELVRAGRGDEATEMLNAAVRRFAPEQPREVALLRADVLHERGETQRAIGILRGLVSEDPSDLETEAHLAHLHAEAGDIGQAERHYRNVLRALGDAQGREHLLARTLNNLAFTLGEAGLKLEEALDFAARALELNPRADYILDTKGRVLYHLGRFDEAEGYLRQAEARSFGDPEILVHLGDLYRSLGRASTARRYYDRALELDPEHGKALERSEDFRRTVEEREVTGASPAP